MNFFATHLISQRSGLSCRYGDCDVMIPVNGHLTSDIVEAAKVRNHHEVKAHGYLHKVEETPMAKNRGFTKSGRSTLTR